MNVPGFLLIILASISMTLNAAAQSTCIPPKLIKPIEDWEIIADNNATINTAPYFSGSSLTYSSSAKPTKMENKILINSHNGELKINAQTKDNFDIKITAKNSCGSVKSSFNVQIDEEE